MAPRKSAHDVSEQRLKIFVPAGRHADLDFVQRGSAIVGEINSAGLALVDYEGDVARAVAGGRTMSFTDKLRLATARHVPRMPTVARFYDLDAASLRLVGTCDHNGRIIGITDQDALDAWLA